MGFEATIDVAAPAQLLFEVYTDGAEIYERIGLDGLEVAYEVFEPPYLNRV